MRQVTAIQRSAPRVSSHALVQPTCHSALPVLDAASGADPPASLRNARCAPRDLCIGGVRRGEQVSRSVASFVPAGRRMSSIGQLVEPLRRRMNRRNEACRAVRDQVQERKAQRAQAAEGAIR